ncbi:AAA-ATPase [Gordonia Phage Sephiroth]|uniref:AAA-ATPase n=1 Tax=Gordonia Phage Sephiroth TaxID=2767553 RepID=A0A7G9UZJ7_9CAUD|nr:AAA-ATPase [Gordonia Phage Sephiroth]QNN99452.1 AAA-ATPase [Gordonia Phage Sephiroth]
MPKHSKPVEVDDRGMPYLDHTTIEIFGDRQSGKTEALCRYAFFDLVLERRRVLYAGWTHAMVQERIRAIWDYIQLSPDAGDWKMYNSSSRREIWNTKTDAVLFFTSYNSPGRPICVDTFLMDDVNLLIENKGRQKYEDMLISARFTLLKSANPKLVVTSCG